MLVTVMLVLVASHATFNRNESAEKHALPKLFSLSKFDIVSEPVPLLRYWELRSFTPRAAFGP